MKISGVLVLFGAFELFSAEKILFLLATSSRSHFILQERLVEELAKRGHEITLLAPYKKSKPFPNVTEISLIDTSDLMFKTLASGNPEEGKFGMRNFSPLRITKFSEAGNLFMETIMNHQPMKEFVRSDQKFDLVVGECMIQEGLVAGLAYKFKAPLALLSPLTPFSYVNEIAGNPAPPSYIPETILGFTDNMSFEERLSNFLFNIMATIAYHCFFIPLQDTLMKKYLGEDIPHLSVLLSQNSVILANSHFSLFYPRPYVPSIVDIAGYHIRPLKPLPEDVQKFMDDAKDGVIYFSMGSNLQSNEFPKEKFEGILKAFAKLKQRVLWKFENENIPTLPKNVKISKWFPQSDILGHPNVKLFITHGGLLSMIETIFRGVPIIGIPIYGDQPGNVKLAEKIGMGTRLEYDNLNEESLFDSVQEVLNNPKYTENAKFRSQILRDRPQPPIDIAIYWLEYVMRYKGTPHLRSGALNLRWYQLYMLDVFAFLGVVLFVIIYSAKKICCSFSRRLRERKKKRHCRRNKIKHFHHCFGVTEL